MNHGSRFAILEEKTVIKKKPKVDAAEEPASQVPEVTSEKANKNKSNKQHKSKRHHNADSGSEQKHEIKPVVTPVASAPVVSNAEGDLKSEKENLELQRQAADLEFRRKKELAERKRLEEQEQKKKMEMDQQEELNSLKALAFGGRKADKFGKKGGKAKPGKDRKKDRFPVHDSYSKTNSQTIEADYRESINEVELTEPALEENKIGSYDNNEEEYKVETQHIETTPAVNYDVEESYTAPRQEKTSKITEEIEVVDRVVDGDNLAALRQEIELLREELRSVKGRNAKLCEVISLSEMGSKNDLVAALQLATKERNEFSAEVCQLKSEIVQLKGWK